MKTKWFDNVLTCIAQSSGDSEGTGVLPVKNNAGTTLYATHRFSGVWPAACTLSVGFTMTGAGIHVGSGNDPATNEDYCLQTPITTGLTAVHAYDFKTKDVYDNPVLRAINTLTNTSSADIVIREMEYKQLVRTATSIGGNGSANTAITFDRTVLANPITIAPGETVIVEYDISTEATSE